ncbi:MAG: response regulator [Ferruginibacter sp.]
MDPSSKKLKIILVDDDKDYLFLFSSKLSNAGYEVKISHNGINLDKIISSEHPDMILLDLHMDNINGEDICKALKSKQETADIPVMILSSNNDIKNVATDCGADAYFEKPLEIVDLEKILEQFKVA